MRFQVNEGPLDRFIRFVLGVGLYALAATGVVAAPWLYLVLLVGTIGLVTGVTGFCLPYGLLGISTLPKGAAEGTDAK